MGAEHRAGNLTKAQIPLLERLRDKGPILELERSIAGSPSMKMLNHLQRKGYVWRELKPERWNITDAGRWALLPKREAWGKRKKRRIDRKIEERKRIEEARMEGEEGTGVSG